MYKIQLNDRDPDLREPAPLAPALTTHTRAPPTHTRVSPHSPIAPPPFPRWRVTRGLHAARTLTHAHASLRTLRFTPYGVPSRLRDPYCPAGCLCAGPRASTPHPTPPHHTQARSHSTITHRCAHCSPPPAPRPSPPPSAAPRSSFEWGARRPHRCRSWPRRLPWPPPQSWGSIRAGPHQW